MNIVPEDAVGFQAWLTENEACEPARTWDGSYVTARAGANVTYR